MNPKGETVRERRAVLALEQLGGEATAREVARVAGFTPHACAAALRQSGRARVGGRQMDSYGHARHVGLALWRIVP